MDFLNTFIDGLSSGGTYAMIALGYTMVYGIAKMLNFAHGDIIMVGGYTLFVTIMQFGHPIFGHPIVGLVFAVICCVLFGVTIEKIAYKPLRGASPLAVLITAIGVSYLLQSAAQIKFGTQSEPVNIFDNLGVLRIGELEIKCDTLITLGSSIVIMIALSLFVKYSKTGRAMIAVSEDKGAAQLMGINVNKIITITCKIRISIDWIIWN